MLSTGLLKPRRGRAQRPPSSCGARGRHGAPTSTGFGARAAEQAGAAAPTSSAIRGCRRCGRQRRRAPRRRAPRTSAGERPRVGAAAAPARMTARPPPHLPARARPPRPWTLDDHAAVENEDEDLGDAARARAQASARAQERQQPQRAQRHDRQLTWAASAPAWNLQVRRTAHAARRARCA